MPHHFWLITIVPNLHGTSLAELDTPKFYLPNNISVVTNDEIQQLEDVYPADIKKTRRTYQGYNPSANIWCWFTPAHSRNNDDSRAKNSLVHNNYYFHLCYINPMNHMFSLLFSISLHPSYYSKTQYHNLYYLIPLISTNAREHRTKTWEPRTRCCLCIIPSAADSLKHPESFLQLRPTMKTFREIAAVALRTPR